MTQVGQTQPVSAAAAAPRRRSSWAGPLVAGLGFGLAFGITQRLVGLNMGELIRFGHGFDVQVFPGTSLESLRLRFGAADSELRGDLELQDRQRRQGPPPASPAAPLQAPSPEASALEKPRDEGAMLPSDEVPLEPVPEAPSPPADPAAEPGLDTGR
jgi:predicted lipid-binding transport protein (Tim44 family)